MGQGWSSPKEWRIFSRTAGGTAGLSANCDMGSFGARESTAKIIKLIARRVGMARSARRIKY